jgi:hypothetical protein
VLVGNRSIGEVKVNALSSIQDLRVRATFFAIFKLDKELTRTFLPLIAMDPDLSSL